MLLSITQQVKPTNFTRLSVNVRPDTDRPNRTDQFLVMDVKTMKTLHYTVERHRKRELWSRLTNLEQAAYIHAAVQYETSVYGGTSLRDADETVRMATSIAYASYKATGQPLDNLNPKGFALKDHPDEADKLVLVQVETPDE